MPPIIAIAIRHPIVTDRHRRASSSSSYDIMVRVFFVTKRAVGLTTDRQILFFFTYLSGRQAPFRASEQRTGDDGQTNSVSFDTICLAVERLSISTSCNISTSASASVHHHHGHGIYSTIVDIIIIGYGSE